MFIFILTFLLALPAHTATEIKLFNSIEWLDEQFHPGSWELVAEQTNFFTQAPSAKFFFHHISRDLNFLNWFLTQRAIQNNQNDVSWEKPLQIPTFLITKEEEKSLKQIFNSQVDESACRKLKNPIVQELLKQREQISNSNGAPLFALTFETKPGKHLHFLSLPRPAKTTLEDDNLYFWHPRSTVRCPCQENRDIFCLEIIGNARPESWVANMLLSIFAPQSWMRTHKKTTAALALTSLFALHELFAPHGNSYTRRIKNYRLGKQRNTRLAQIKELLLNNGSLLHQDPQGQKYPALNLTQINAEELKKTLESSPKKVFAYALDLPFSHNTLDYKPYFQYLQKLIDDSIPAPIERQKRILVIPLSVIARFTFSGEFEKHLHKAHNSTVESFVNKLNEKGWKVLAVPDLLSEDLWECETMQYFRYDFRDTSSSQVHFTTYQDLLRQATAKDLHWVLYPTSKELHRSSATSATTEAVEIGNDRNDPKTLGEIINDALANC